MSNSDADQRCMICRAIGFVIAAIIVGLVTWWLFGKVAAWLAILAFLGLFALGLWLVLKYCGNPVGYDADHASASGSSHGAGMAAGAAGVAAAGAGAALAGSASASGSDTADVAAAARAEADAKAAQMKADADAAAAKAKADADAAAAKAKAEAAEKAQAEADAAAEKAKADAAAKAKADAAAAAEKAKADAAVKAQAEADAAAAKAKADADAAASAKAAEVEAARVKAEQDAAKAKAEAERAAAAKAEAPASRKKSVADGLAKGGASSTTSTGTKPKGLKAARSGGADDLKRIKGVGPKMENMLNGMGYYHFDQVGAWGDQEVAWVDDNLEGFKGRVTRDRWVPQAKLLAGGGSVSDDVLERISAGETVDLTDYDGDGVSEGTGEGTRPSTLDGPRGGKADNLKEIKGVGPKMEKMLHGMGFYHFDQVAAWTANEVAWVDANLEGFKGRVSRDEWVKQAKILASGGETEFSQRVGDGDVY